MQVAIKPMTADTLDIFIEHWEDMPLAQLILICTSTKVSPWCILAYEYLIEAA